MRKSIHILIFYITCADKAKLQQVFVFCVSSSLSLVQSNVNTEKDDNRSDDKDIDCTNSESEFSKALYELFLFD